MDARVRTPVVVLGGTPNVGKTTLFNRLTGGRARVGNYPGVTVTRHEGRLTLPDLRTAVLYDSPGCYSLCARSIDEFLAARSMAGIPPEEPPDLVVLVVDATRLERTLYPALQLAEFGVPFVVALNLIDEAEREGVEVDAERLSRELGVPVVPVSARRNRGIEQLARVVAAALHDRSRARPKPFRRPLPPEVERIVEEMAEAVPPHWHRLDEERRRALAIWALLTLDEDDEAVGIPTEVREAVGRAAARAAESNLDLERDLIAPVWARVEEIARTCVREHRVAREVTRRLDRFFLHPLLGPFLFVILMGLAFEVLFTGADPFVESIEEGLARFSSWLAPLLPEGLVREFLVDGVVAGVGAFLVFLPQIAFLFLFLHVLEDTGYMARVSVLVDRLMRTMGLHGRAFVPMLSAFACAVPAILSTRTLERRRDRLLTILVVPFMTCSARLPVYALLIAVLVPPGPRSGWIRAGVLVGLYAAGTAMALLAALALGRFVLPGRRAPLLVELPPYRLPQWRTVGHQVFEQCAAFVKRAGTVILVGSMLLWAATNFPRDEEMEARYERAERALLAQSGPGRDERLAEIEAERRQARTRHSYAGRLAALMEPALRPLGFDESIGIGLLGAFAAREVFVSTMGVVYGVGGDVDEGSPRLRDRMKAARWPDGRPVFTAATCLALLLFFAFACQCMSTLVVAARETGSWGWSAFLFAYMLAVAWLSAFLVQSAAGLLRAAA